MKNSLLFHFKLLGYFNLKRKEPVSAKDGVIIKLIGVHYSTPAKPAQVAICFFHPSFNYTDSISSANQWVKAECQPPTSVEGPTILYLGGSSDPVFDGHGKKSLLKILRGEHYKEASPLEGSSLNVCGLHIMTILPAYPRVTALGSRGADILV